jgi:hypothetical protein
MKSILLSLLLLTPLCAVAQSTVNWSAGPGQRDVRLPSGQPVFIGTASIGAFDGDGWREYGITDVREIFGELGRFAGTASMSDSFFTGEQIYLRIDSGSTGGLYTSTSGWVFPDPYAIPPNNTLSINTSQIDTALYGFFNDNHLILVPEPSPVAVIVGWFIGLAIVLIVRPRK